MRSSRLVCVVGLLAVAVVSGVTVGPGASPRALAAAPSTPRDHLEGAHGELLAAAREYRASLENLAALREEALTRARDVAATRQRLADEGLIARREAEAAAQALAAAEEALAATRAEIAAADHVMTEATANALLATLPAAGPGSMTVTPMLVRFQGVRDWTLTQLTSVQEFFADRFGRALPVSALGQTRTHDRLGFDHRNALDVAVHPDSAEGQALLAWLRSRGVSFFAYRGPVVGESTGAHVHIGEPSPRLTSPRTG
jgi:hypothetical protein